MMIGKEKDADLNCIEYCYCHHCKRIKEGSDLALTDKGLQCTDCGSYELEEPQWVICPHQKMTSVKCPRAGKGIINNGSGLECTDRCFFRV